MSYQELLDSLNAGLNSVNLALMAALLRVLQKWTARDNGSGTGGSSFLSSASPEPSVTGCKPSAGGQSRTSDWTCPLLDETPGTVLLPTRAYLWPSGAQTPLSALPCCAQDHPVLPGTCATCVRQRSSQGVPD